MPWLTSGLALGVHFLTPNMTKIRRSTVLAWAERAGYQDLEDIEPITVAAYIEILQHQAAPPTVKQHMAAIRMLFSWLTEKGALAMNPAREVKTERFWLNSNKGTKCDIEIRAARTFARGSRL
jgi:site-specific recombinase XerC